MSTTQHYYTTNILLILYCNEPFRVHNTKAVVLILHPGWQCIHKGKKSKEAKLNVHGEQKSSGTRRHLWNTNEIIQHNADTNDMKYTRCLKIDYKTIYKNYEALLAGDI